MRTKPRSPGTPVRWSHPLAKGLVRAWNFNGRRGRDSGGWTFRDSVAGDTGTYVRNDADTVWSNGPAGPAFKAGASGGGEPFTTATSLSKWGITASSFTIIGRLKKTGSNPNLEQHIGTAGSAILSTRVLEADTAGLTLFAGTSVVRFAADGNGLALGAEVSATVSSDVWYTLGGTYQRDTSVGTYGGYWRAYLDGQPGAANSYSLAGSYGGTLTDNTASFGRRDNERVSDKFLDYVYVWNRDLSPQEVAWVTDRPFEFYRQPAAWSVGATAGGGAANNVVWLLTA